MPWSLKITVAAALICLAFGLLLAFLAGARSPAEFRPQENALSLLGTNSAESASIASRDQVFQEDFEGGLERWEIVNPQSWKLEGHGLGKSLTIIQRESEYEPKVRSPRHIALIKEIRLASFELNFKVKNTKDTGNHRDCCVLFNYQDPTKFYYAHLGAKPDPNCGQVFIVNDAPRAPLTDNRKIVPWSQDWHQVKVIRDSAAGTIAIYFDDMETPHLRVNDKTFGLGRIGIGSFDDMNAFDEIRLRALDN